MMHKQSTAVMAREVAAPPALARADKGRLVAIAEKKMSMFEAKKKGTGRRTAAVDALAPGSAKTLVDYPKRRNFSFDEIGTKEHNEAMKKFSLRFTDSSSQDKKYKLKVGQIVHFDKFCEREGYGTFVKVINEGTKKKNYIWPPKKK